MLCPLVDICSRQFLCQDSASNSVWIHGSSVLCLMCFLQKEGHQCPRVPGPEQGDSFINGTPGLALLVRILCQSPQGILPGHPAEQSGVSVEGGSSMWPSGDSGFLNLGT